LLGSIVSEFDDESVSLWNSLKKSLTWKSGDKVEIGLDSKAIIGVDFTSLVSTLELISVNDLPFLLNLLVECSPLQGSVGLGLKNFTLLIGEEFSNKFVHLPPSVGLSSCYIYGFTSTIADDLEPVVGSSDTTDHLFLLNVNPLSSSQV